MKLPVFGIVWAALRDLARLALQHPVALLIATACIVPINYRLALIELSEPASSSPITVVESLALSALAFIIWLPLTLTAIRQSVAGIRLSLGLGCVPSAATCQYAAYGVLMQLAAGLAGTVAASSAFAIIPAVTLSWFAARTTLTFTALAVGRRDLGLARSIAMTSKRTVRLIAIALVTIAVVMVFALVLAFGLIVALAIADVIDVADIENRLNALTLLGAWSSLANLATALAGAHIYRAIEPESTQNGRY